MNRLIPPPELKDLSIEVDDDELIVKLKISDLQSGLRDEEEPNSSGGHEHASLSFTSPSGRQRVHLDFHDADRIDGDEFLGTYKASIELDDYHENGMWSLSSIYLSDIVGNEFP